MTDLLKRIKEGWAPAIICAVLTIAYIGITIYAVGWGTHSINESRSMVDRIGDAWFMSLGYFLLTTKNSERKTELLATAPPVNPIAMESR